MLKKFYSGLLYLAFAAASVASLQAGAVAQSVSGSEVKRVVESYIRQSVASTVEIATEFKDLKASYPTDGPARSIFVASSNSVSMKGLVTFIVKVGTGREDWNSKTIIPVTVRVRTFQTVLVSTKTIQPRAEIGTDAVTSVRSETTDLPNPVLDMAQLKGKWTSRWIQEGKIITFDMMDNEPIVKRGDDVVIVVRTKNVVVREQGNALQDGKLDDLIRITNEYRDNLRGKVVAKGEVVLVN